MAVDPLTQAAGEIIAQSPVLRDRLNRLVSDLLDEAEEVVENGSPRMKADLINRMVPHLVKQMQEKQEDEEIVRLRAEMEIVKEMMRPQIGPITISPTPATPMPEDQPRDVAEVLALAHRPRQHTPGKRA